MALASSVILGSESRGTRILLIHYPESRAAVFVFIFGRFLSNDSLLKVPVMRYACNLEEGIIHEKQYLLYSSTQVFKKQQGCVKI
jgi:hypothetical protein